jgi:hypothetical protein
MHFPKSTPIYIKQRFGLMEMTLRHAEKLISQQRDELNLVRRQLEISQESMTDEQIDLIRKKAIEDCNE